MLEDRYGNRSALATSQLPIDQWHSVIGDPTLADAITIENPRRYAPTGGSFAPIWVADFSGIRWGVYLIHRMAKN